jgi:adenylate kinase family enzyme
MNWSLSSAGQARPQPTPVENAAPRCDEGVMQDQLKRVGITGASGCGVTTLGAALAARLDAVHIDMDDHFWIATDPPYQQKRDVPERLARIRAEQAQTGRWVISGTLDGWAESVTRETQLIVFLEVPTELRLARLRRREQARFGESLLPGGAMHETHREFIEWAAQYDDGMLPGRSRPRHEKWLAAAVRPVLRLDGTKPTADLVSAIVSFKLPNHDGMSGQDRHSSDGRCGPAE